MRRLVIPLLLAAPLAHAQTPDSPIEVIVTATRIATPAAVIPAGITIIDRAAIESRGYTTLTEALGAVPGLRIVQSGGPGGNSSVFIRGTNSNHVLVLRDGLQVNDPADPGNAFNFGVDTLEDLERIEVVRGPMSGLYGSGAIGGVINLVTRKGEGPLHGSVEIAGGLPRAVLGRAQVAGRSGIFDYAASLETRSDQGSDVTPRRLSIYTGERDGFRSQLATVSLGITPIENTRFSVMLRARRSVFGYDNVGGFPGFDDPNLTGRDSNLYGRVGGTSTLLNGVWQTSLFIGRSQTDRRFTNLLDLPDGQSGDSRYNGRRSDIQWNNTVKLPATPVTADAAVTFGYQHIADQARVRANSDFSGFGFSQSAKAHSDSDAGYVGLQGTVLSRLTVTANVRGEATTLTQDATTYRVGGVVAVPEVLSKLRASYGTAFRAPSLFDRYGVDSFGYVGNPALKPERSRGYELGVTTELPVYGRADGITLSATYFDNRIRDLIQSQFGAVSTVVNVARATARGVEAMITLRPASWVDADLSYTYTDTRNVTTGQRLLRRPLNAAAANVRLRPYPGLTIAPELIYTGAFQDFLVDDAGFGRAVGRARSGLIANLNVTYDVTERIGLFAWAKNIGGSRFEPASGFATPGPSFLAGTRVKF